MRMFIVNQDYPYRICKDEECHVKTFPSGNTWAILKNGKRRMVGATAFSNEASALRSQIALCIDLVTSQYVKSHISWKYEQAMQFLESHRINCRNLPVKKYKKQIPLF